MQNQAEMFATLRRL